MNKKIPPNRNACAILLLKFKLLKLKPGLRCNQEGKMTLRAAGGMGYYLRRARGPSSY